jgi:predicted TIM-barrel fold metal-dependent hydrolase
VCFGSDALFNIIHVKVTVYHTLLEDELNREYKHKVMVENILRVLGLSTL